MKYFITGATGFIGSWIVHQLAKDKKNEITCYVRNLAKTTMLPQDSVSFIEGDITDSKAVRDAMVGTDMVIHAAGVVRHAVIRKKDLYDTNILGTRAVFNAAYELGIKKVVYIGSAGIYHPTRESTATIDSIVPTEHKNYYAHTKYVAHTIADEYSNKGLSVVEILPVSVYGEGSPLFAELFDFLLKYRIFTKQLASKRISLVHADDVAQLTVQATDEIDESRMFIASYRDVSLCDMIQLLEKRSGKRIHILPVPSICMWLFVRMLDLVSWVTRVHFYLNSQNYNFINGNMVASGVQTIEEFGWEQKDFDLHIARMVDWYLGQKNK